MIDITDATDAEIDFIMVKALILARAADFNALVYDGTPMIHIELNTYRRLPCHPDYATDPVFHRIRVEVCGGMPLAPRARKRACLAAIEIQEVIDTPIVFEGITGTDPFLSLMRKKDVS